MAFEGGGEYVLDDEHDSDSLAGAEKRGVDEGGMLGAACGRGVLDSAASVQSHAPMQELSNIS